MEKGLIMEFTVGQWGRGEGGHAGRPNPPRASPIPRTVRESSTIKGFTVAFVQVTVFGECSRVSCAAATPPGKGSADVAAEPIVPMAVVVVWGHHGFADVIAGFSRVSMV